MQSTEDADQPAWVTLPVPQTAGPTPEPDSPHVPLANFIHHNPNKRLYPEQHSYLRNWCKDHQRTPTPQDHEVMPQVVSRGQPGEKYAPADVYKYCQTYWKGYLTRKKHEGVKDQRNKKIAGTWATAKLLIPQLTEDAHVVLLGLHVQHPSPNPQLMEIIANRVALPIATVSGWFKLITALNAGEAPPAAPITAGTANQEEIDELDANSQDGAIRQPAAHLPTPTSDSFSPPPNIDPASLRENLSIKTENLQSGPPSPVHSQTGLPTPVTCAPTPTTVPCMMASPSAAFPHRALTEANADGPRSIPSQLRRDNGGSMSPSTGGGRPLPVAYQTQAAVQPQSPVMQPFPFYALREQQAGPPQTQHQLPAHYLPQQPSAPHRRVSYPLAQPNHQQHMRYQPYHHAPPQHSQLTTNYRQNTFRNEPHPKAVVPPPPLGCPTPVVSNGYYCCVCDQSKPPLVLGPVQVHPRAASNPDIRQTEQGRPDQEMHLPPRLILSPSAHQPVIHQTQQMSTIPTPAQAQAHYHAPSRPIASTSAHTLDMVHHMSVPSQGPPQVPRQNVGYQHAPSQTHRQPTSAATQHPPHQTHRQPTSAATQHPPHQTHRQPTSVAPQHSPHARQASHAQSPVRQNQQRRTVSAPSTQPSPPLGVITGSSGPIEIHSMTSRAVGLFDAVFEGVRRTEAGDFPTGEPSAVQLLEGIHRKAVWIMSDIGKELLKAGAAPPPAAHPPPPPPPPPPPLLLLPRTVWKRW